MQKIRILIASSLILWTPFQYAWASATARVEGLSVAGICGLINSDAAGATLAFSIIYDNNLPGTPTRFKVEAFGVGGKPLTGAIKIPMPESEWKNGILDLSRYSAKGGLSGLIILKGYESCVNGQRATESDFRIELTPVN